ncbi:unnamed protein product [Ambrosiozyma monospora]|uniref:Unnamed protein product n=1 Tax=Ambrosiozyma monospora TaxID=43982 RepID=A0A9W7DDS2_AMBMO|nr:unnamed protein product [Ambrosiozyma monospora]
MQFSTLLISLLAALVHADKTSYSVSTITSLEVNDVTEYSTIIDSTCVPAIHTSVNGTVTYTTYNTCASDWSQITTVINVTPTSTDVTTNTATEISWVD